MEYFKDFDFELKYYPGKENKVEDALSRKEMHKAELVMWEYDLLKKFQNHDLQFSWTKNGVMMGNLNVSSNLRERIRQIQLLGEDSQAVSTQLSFTQTTDEVLLFNQRVCVPKDVELKRKVL